MDHLHSTTTEQRVLIQTHLKDGWCPNKIDKEIGCAPSTVRKEVKRSTVALYKENFFRCKAAEQATYEQNRQVGCQHYNFLEKVDFILFLMFNLLLQFAINKQ